MPDDRSHFDVEREVNGHWTTVANDNHPDTRLFWFRNGRYPQCRCEWKIPAGCSAGVFRLVHRGTVLRSDGTHEAYEGTGRPFEVVPLGVRRDRTYPFARLPVFRGIAVADVRALEAMCPVRDAPVGQPLVRQEGTDRDLLCLLSGRVRVVADGLEVARAGPADLIGEQALFDGGARSADVFAVDVCRYACISRPTYEAMVARHNRTAYAIERYTLAALARRVDRIAFILSRLSRTKTPPPRSRPTIAELWSRLVGTAPTQQELPPADIVTTLAETSVFQDLESATLGRMARWFEVVHVEPGTALFAEGEPGDSFFVVGRGQVELLMSHPDHSAVHRVGQVGTGGLFGLSALASRRFRTVSAVAATHVTAFVLGRDRWESSLAQDDTDGSSFRVVVIRALSAQLRRATGHLVALDLGDRGLVAEAGRQRLDLDLAQAMGVTT